MFVYRKITTIKYTYKIAFLVMTAEIVFCLRPNASPRHTHVFLSDNSLYLIALHIIYFSLTREDFGSECCPVLKYVQQKGNTTVYEWRTGRKPERVVEPELDVSDDPQDLALDSQVRSPAGLCFCVKGR